MGRLASLTLLVAAVAATTASSTPARHGTERRAREGKELDVFIPAPPADTLKFGTIWIGSDAPGLARAKHIPPLTITLGGSQTGLNIGAAPIRLSYNRIVVPFVIYRAPATTGPAKVDFRFRLKGYPIYSDGVVAHTPASPDMCGARSWGSTYEKLYWEPNSLIEPGLVGGKRSRFAIVPFRVMCPGRPLLQVPPNLKIKLMKTRFKDGTRLALTLPRIGLFGRGTKRVPYLVSYTGSVTSHVVRPNYQGGSTDATMTAHYRAQWVDLLDVQRQRKEGEADPRFLHSSSLFADSTGHFFGTWQPPYGPCPGAGCVSPYDCTWSSTFPNTVKMDLEGYGVDANGRIDTHQPSYAKSGLLGFGFEADVTGGATINCTGPGTNTSPFDTSEPIGTYTTLPAVHYRCDFEGKPQFTVSPHTIGLKRFNVPVSAKVTNPCSLPYSRGDPPPDARLTGTVYFTKL